MGEEFSSRNKVRNGWSIWFFSFFNVFSVNLSLHITVHDYFIKKFVKLWNSVFLRKALHDRPLVGVNNGRSSIFPGNRFCKFCHEEKIVSLI